MAFCLGVGLLFSVASLANCKASQLPADYCHSFAEGWYQEAVSLGSETPDGVYEQAEADCELQMYGREQAALWSPSVSLDAMMRADIARRVAEADAHMWDDAPVRGDLAE